VSARIAAETIHQLAVDEQVTDRRGVVVPDAIKDNVGDIVAGYIDDVNFTMAHDGDPGRGLSSARDSELFPGVEGAHAIREEYGARDAEYNAAIERNGAIANFVFGKAAEAIKNPLISETVGLGVESYIDALVENSKHDSTNLANAEVAQVYGDGRATVREMAEDALWRHGALPASVQTQYPGLFENGQPRPLADIMADETTRAQWESYATSEHYLSTTGHVVGETDQSYSTGRDRAREATSGG
jgi:hypothetical protein